MAAAVDERHRPVLVDRLDDANVGEAVVALAVAIAVVGIAEEDQIPGARRSFAKRPVLPRPYVHRLHDAGARREPGQVDSFASVDEPDESAAVVGVAGRDVRTRP